MSRMPLTVDAQMSIEAAAEVMRRHDVGEAFVTDGGNLRGLLTLRDIAVWSIAADRHPGTILARECCNPDRCWVSVDATTEDALTLMRQEVLQRLAVVDRGLLVGSLWISDVIAASPRPEGRSDQAEQARWLGQAGELSQSRGPDSGGPDLGD